VLGKVLRAYRECHAHPQATLTDIRTGRGMRMKAIG
jgi:hypothetical protein